MEQESERIGKDAMECQVIADDAQADLAVAMPALEKAMVEVDKLDKTSITEVNVFQRLIFRLGAHKMLLTSASLPGSAE